MWFWWTQANYDDLTAKLETLHANQLVIINKLNSILGKENQMVVDVSALTAEVERNSSVTNSVVQLVQNLAAQIAAIPPSDDPATQAALDNLRATLEQNDTKIADAVTANTAPTP